MSETDLVTVPAAAFEGQRGWRMVWLESGVLSAPYRPEHCVLAHSLLLHLILLGAFWEGGDGAELIHTFYLVGVFLQLGKASWEERCKGKEPVQKE